MKSLLYLIILALCTVFVVPKNTAKPIDQSANTIQNPKPIDAILDLENVSKNYTRTIDSIADLVEKNNRYLINRKP